MGELIQLVKVSPAAPLDDAPPRLVPVRSILAVELPDPDSAPPSPPGVFLVRLDGYTGRYWTWNLDAIPDGTLCTREAPIPAHHEEET